MSSLFRFMPRPATMATASCLLAATNGLNKEKKAERQPGLPRWHTSGVMMAPAAVHMEERIPSLRKKNSAVEKVPLMRRTSVRGEKVVKTAGMEALEKGTDFQALLSSQEMLSDLSPAMIK